MTFEDPKKKNEDQEMTQEEGLKGGETTEDIKETGFDQDTMVSDASEDDASEV